MYIHTYIYMYIYAYLHTYTCILFSYYWFHLWTWHKLSEQQTSAKNSKEKGLSYMQHTLWQSNKQYIGYLSVTHTHTGTHTQTPTITQTHTHTHTHNYHSLPALLSISWHICPLLICVTNPSLCDHDSIYIYYSHVTRLTHMQHDSFARNRTQPHTPMSHVTHLWVMSHTYESCHIDMTHPHVAWLIRTWHDSLSHATWLVHT